MAGQPEQFFSPPIAKSPDSGLYLPSVEREQMLSKFVLLSGMTHPELAQATARELGKIIAPGSGIDIPVEQPSWFFDEGKEVGVNIKTNLRGRDVFIFQPIARNVDKGISANDSFVDLLAIVDAAKRASAGRIHVVIPYYGYGRQDRKPLGREPITASLVANLLREAGVYAFLTVDLHNEATMGSVSGMPWDNLRAEHILIPALDKELPHPRVVVSPDAGGVSRARRVAKALRASLAVANKQRNFAHPEESETDGLLGDIAGYHALLVDDVVAGGGSLQHAAELVAEQDALSVTATVSHAQLYGDARRRIHDSPITTLHTSDSLPQTEATRNDPLIKFHSIARMLARAIWCVETGESIQETLLNNAGIDG